MGKAQQASTSAASAHCYIASGAQLEKCVQVMQQRVGAAAIASPRVPPLIKRLGQCSGGNLTKRQCKQ
jgi:hypothetical protein